jgi:D-alanyl-D-alanine carboxypeptidase
MTALFRRIAVGVLAVLAATALYVSPFSPVEAQSSDNARYAAIVVDAQTGEVLFARRADSARYPASVTKMMTLYLTFEALEAGRVKLDDIVTVSPLAASQPPSKLGLASGQTIRFDDAMRATTVRSCNDMAMVLAEHVGGSQARFAAMATLKARQLGMTQTNYVNPNGLPDSRQVTSARDLAILARAIMRDYPQYYSYFGLHDWAFQGREYRNTNGLLLGGNGYDGIKTGFTNASGYNLAASAVRDHRRIIVIVMGGRSSATRNAHVAELMNTGFEVETRRAQGETIQIAQTFFEQRGFGVDGADGTPGGGAPIAYASLNGERGSPSSAGPVRDDEDGEASPTAVAYTAQPRQPQPPAPSSAYVAVPESTAPGAARSYAAVANQPPVPVLRAEPGASANVPPANLTASLNGGVAPPSNAHSTTRGAPPTTSRPTPSRPAAPARPPAGRWAVQVGAFRNETVARDWLTEVNRRFRTQFTDAERAVQSNDGWFRSRFTGMTQAKAEDACEALAARRVTCSVIRPGA